jgi:hypothetical protein
MASSTMADWEQSEPLHTPGPFALHDDGPDCERCVELTADLVKARALLRMLIAFAPKPATAGVVDADPLELQIIGIEAGLQALKTRYGFFLARKP